MIQEATARFSVIWQENCDAELACGWAYKCCDEKRVISESGTDVTNGVGGCSRAVARRGSVVCAPVKLVASFQSDPSS